MHHQPASGEQLVRRTSAAEVRVAHGPYKWRCGRRPKHDLPVVGFRIFSHFSKCTSPADNPSATGPRSGDVGTISKFRPSDAFGAIRPKSPKSRLSPGNCIQRALRMLPPPPPTAHSTPTLGPTRPPHLKSRGEPPGPARRPGPLFQEHAGRGFAVASSAGSAGSAYTPPARRMPISSDRIRTARAGARFGQQQILRVCRRAGLRRRRRRPSRRRRIGERRTSACGE